MKSVGACLIGQSGGPTSVLNASALGCIEAAMASKKVSKVYGAATEFAVYSMIESMI